MIQGPENDLPVLYIMACMGNLYSYPLLGLQLDYHRVRSRGLEFRILIVEAAQTSAVIAAVLP